MKKQIAVLVIGCLVAGVVSAATTFTGAVDTDFANAGNWDAGEPSNVNIGTIKDGLTAVSSVDDNAGVIIGADGTAGTLDITGGLFRSDSGDMKVGVGAGSIGTVNVADGATLRTQGNHADLFIGDLDGGYGTVNVNAGATYDAVKAIEIINGQLTFAATANSVPGFKDELVVDDNGILAFQTDGSTIATLHGNTGAFPRILELGLTSTLDMQLGGTYSIGDSWVVTDNILDFDGSGGVFGTVYDSTDAANEFSVDYGVTVAGSVIVTLTASSAPMPNEFTGLGDGSSWTDPANWVSNTPSSTLEAIVNSNLTANLSGAAGNAKFLKVGTIDSQSGTVNNGSLTVDGYTQIGTEANATGTVNLSAYAATHTNSVMVGSATGASGSLTASSGTVDAEAIYVASASNSVGVLDLGTGTISVASELIVAGGTDSDGTVNASALTLAEGVDLNVATGTGSTADFGSGMTIVMNPTNGLFVGTAVGSSHNLLASNFSVTGPIGDIEIGEGTGAEIAALINANASVGSLVVNDAFTFTPGGGSNLITALTVNDALTIEAGALVSLHTNSSVYVANVPGVGASLNFVAGETNRFTSLRVAIAPDSTGEVTAEALFASMYFSVASQSNSSAIVSATTLDRSGFYGFQISQGQDSYARITADNGTINAGANNSFRVASGISSEAMVAMTNGTLNIEADKNLEVAIGSNSTATVYFGTINIPGTNAVNIATGADSAATVTSMGGSMTVSNLNVGSGGALVLAGENSLVVVGGDLASTIVSGGYVDLMDSTTFTWDGMVEADFIALWNVGKLRSNGKSGLTSAAFADYFVADGDTLTTVSRKPIGDITIAGPLAGGGLVISWDTALGQDYNVETNGNLIIPSWGVYDSVVGNGGGISVTSTTEHATLFYKVTTP